MPKARARRRSSPARNGQRVATVPRKNTVLATEQPLSGQTRVPTRQPGTMNIQSLLMPAMVALGCWGMGFTFAVFSTDPNRLLFAGIAVLMAIMWSVSFGVRLRKMLYRR